MSEYALPCVVCGEKLRNVMPDADNQPNDGVYLETHGNYGSTVYDPMDGHFLELAICDECLVRAGEQGRVLEGRKWRYVFTEWLSEAEDDFGGPTIVGREMLDRPVVPWNRDLPGYGDEDCVTVEPEEVGKDMGRIEWQRGIPEYYHRMLSKEEG
jgi:hypothetical protein